MLHPEFKTFLDMLHAGPRWETYEPHALRELTASIRTPAEPVEGVATRDLTVSGAVGPLNAKLYLPEGCAEVGPGLVYFHGGGWVIGDLESHDQVCRRLAKGSGVKVLSVDYRLAPEHKFPASHDDALASTRWVFDNAASIGFDPDRIGIGGDSAGGNMAASVALDLRDDPARRLRFQLLLYPMTQVVADLSSRREFAEGHFVTASLYEYFMEHLFAEAEQRTDPRVAVLDRSDLSGAPPAFISVGSYDILRDENRLYAEKLQAAGASVEFREYPSFIHGFYGFAHLVPEVLPAYDQAAEALKRALA